VFWLKKVVASWLMPLPLCAVLAFVGLVLLRSKRTARLGRGLCVAAASILLILSNRYVSTRLLDSFEGRYPAIPEMQGHVAPAELAGCRFVAVLGGGHSNMAGKAATSLLSSSALARVVEAVRILAVLPEARLVVSGPGEGTGPTHASVLARAAESLGVDPRRITLIDTARDTEDESFAFARIAGGARVALVTSAWHMPRAALLFRKAGVDFIACPADFVSRAGPGFSWTDLGCDAESLERSTYAVHEAIGILWLRLRGAV
jgi:uncharacterized SAM-binding protein YcdF (DUF218 family)